MSRKWDQELERQIVSRAVSDAIHDGYLLSVNDGEETTLERSSNHSDILAAMFTTGQDRLYLKKPDNREGWVLFIYGNVEDVISDYTTNLEEVLKGANEFAQRWSD